MAVMALLVGAFQAHATDLYGPAAGELQIPSLRIGTGTYSNVVLSIASIVTPPSGTSAIGTEDIYNPVTNHLTVPAVKVGTTTLYNAVGAVAKLTSIGSVSGADSFDGTHLHVPYVVVGTTPYYNVVLAVSLANVAAVHGGMPSVLWDQYDASAGQLTIPAVQYGSTVYTNVILKVELSDVVSVGITESVLHSFFLGYDGAYPDGDLVQANDGNLYGMTYNGGGDFDDCNLGCGAVIKITPAGTETLLIGFFYSGANPHGSLIQANDGNLYGMTSLGDFLFKMTLAGAAMDLYIFPAFAGDGATPLGALIQGSDGNFYGTTSAGGTNGNGTVFKITIGGVETWLYSFGSVAGDGSYPNGSLIQASDDNFYGTTSTGGANGAGTVFKITPAGSELVLHSFGARASGDGESPYGSLIQASDGNFYGMTLGGGSNGTGAVFKITPAGAESVLYSFGAAGSGDANSPYGNLIQASDGNFYGMTYGGGANTCGSVGCGAVIRITTAGAESVLYSFGANANDGQNPYGSLIQASDGNLYGMTHGGGAGTVIRINW